MSSLVLWLTLHSLCFSALSLLSELAEFWSKGLVDQLSFIEKNVQGELWIAKSNTMSYADIALYYLMYIFGRDNKEAVDAALATAPKVTARTQHAHTAMRCRGDAGSAGCRGSDGRPKESNSENSANPRRASRLI